MPGPRLVWGRPRLQCATQFFVTMRKWFSVSGITKSRHSRRSVPMTRSQRLLALGLRGGVLSTRSPMCVMDEKTVVMVRGDGFSHLLQCPRCSGVGCHIAVHNPSGLVFDNHEYVEQPKRCRHDNTEVTGQYRRRMIANKDGPALIATRLSPAGVRGRICVPYGAKSGSRA